MSETTAPSLRAYISDVDLQALIERAKAEDMGKAGDVTSQLFIPEDLTTEASIVAREPGVLAGAALLWLIALAYDEAIEVRLTAHDGETVAPGQPLARLTGPLRGLLAMERVALNFACHLSGVATLTHAYVERVAGTDAKVYDTRKTLPGLRALQKYAVACGGGATHRIGLFDAVLIKDNHLTHLDAGDLGKALKQAVRKARKEHPKLKFIMCEVDRLDQLKPACQSGVDLVLLDNMSPDQLAEAVKLRNRHYKGVELEASGGVTLETVSEIAETGVDRISVGALTHSAPALDLGLDIV